MLNLKRKELKMNVYQKLLKIKKPVLIAVYKGDELYKFRILRPDGTCTWVRTYDPIYLYPGEKKQLNKHLFEERSCFNYGLSLKHTVTAMKKYDKRSSYTDEYTDEVIKFTTQLVGTIEL